MTRKRKAFGITVLLIAADGGSSRAQTLPPTVLEIDVENIVQYHEDTPDFSKFATISTITTPTIPKDFGYFLIIGDIVAVNGRPAKGTFVNTTRTANLRPAPNPGQAIADVTRATVNNQAFEILDANGTLVGTIVTFGLGGAGVAPPGSPLEVTQGNNAIIGGTGAFLGVRGQSGQTITPQNIPQRQASMTEDPANRRINGGGKARFVQTVIPMFVAQIVSTPGGPAVTHSSNFTLVSASKPAAQGEILSVFMTGLGPTRPGVDPGRPFPANPLQTVNSPIQVSVNGEPAELLSAVGLPDTTDGYQLNFRVPPDTAKGSATIQVSAAWIPSAPVNIVVQ
jgi:uncharacterized protein (TIGR03437 family)